MKNLLFVVVGFIIGVVLANMGRADGMVVVKDSVLVSDTIIKVDTICMYKPVYVSTRITDTLVLHKTDTIMYKEQKLYRDKLYEAWVSGINPSLDSIKVYPTTEYIHDIKTINNYIRDKKKDWNVSVSAGIGLGKKIEPFIGITVGKTLFSF